MIGTVPLLRLSPSQVAQLLGYCATYRSYLWQHALPTPERNQAIRSIQALQGWLEQFWEQAEQEQPEIALPVSAGEKQTLRQLLSGLIQVSASAPPGEPRSQQLAEITQWRMLIERVGRQTPESPSYKPGW